MDPARGRRWVRRDSFLRDVYVHSLPVSGGGVSRVGGERRFTGAAGAAPARARRSPTARRWIARALERSRLGGDRGARRAPCGRSPRWRRSGAVARGAEAARLVETLAAASATQGAPGPPAARRRSTRRPAAAPAADGTRAGHRCAARSVAHVGRGAARRRRRRPPCRASCAPRVDEPRARAGAELGRLLAREGRGRWARSAAGVALAARGRRRRGGAVPRRSSIWPPAAARGSGGGRSAAARLARSLLGAIVMLLAALLALELPLACGLRRAGARLEERLRGSSCARSRGCRDRYFQSRPVSDMAERAHLLHRAARAADAGGRHRSARRSRSSSSRRRSPGWIRAARRWRSRSASAMLRDPASRRAGGRRARSAHAQPRGRAGALLPRRAAGAGGDPDARRASRRWRASTGIAWPNGCAAARRALARRAGRRRRSQTLVGFGLAAWLLVVSSRARAGTDASDPGTALLARLLGAVAADARLRAGAARPAAPRAAQPHPAPASSRSARPRSDDGGARRAGDRARPTSRTRATPACRVELRRRPRRRGRPPRSSRSTRWRSRRASTSRSSAPSGAGKSSLVGLLLGWHRPGERRGPRRRRAARRRRSSRRCAGGPSGSIPSVYLWNRSLADNLAFGLARAAAPTLAPALADAELDEVVRRLPRGRGDAARRGGRAGVGRRGPAGAVRARRSCAPRPALVILDEPFRGLDRDQRPALLGARAPALVGRDAALRDPRHRRDRALSRASWWSPTARSPRTARRRAAPPARLALRGAGRGRAARAGQRLVGRRPGGASASRTAASSRAARERRRAR